MEALQPRAKMWNQAAQRCGKDPNTGEVAYGVDLLQQTKPNFTETQRYPWTMVHGFYASMGGFTFEVDHALAAFIPGYPQLTLTARGVALLAACGYAPNLSHEEIVDKSKANGLAKSLVCIQALWMALQITGRKMANLPITLLEINTLGHVLCALCIYVLWWNKPLAIKEPTRLQGDWTRPLLAYMFMSSRVSGQDQYRHRMFRFARTEPELKSLLFCPSQTADNASNQVKSCRSSQIPAGTGIDLECTVVGHFQRAQSRLGGQTEPASEPAKPTPAQLLRWRLAGEAIQQYPRIRERFKPVPLSTAGESHLLKPDRIEQLVTMKTQDWPAEDLLRRVPSLIMGMTVWFASMAYGGVHASAWNGPFPSLVEAYLWRFSALYIASSGLLWLSINVLAKVFPFIDEYWERVNSLRCHWPNFVVLGLSCFVCGLAYVVARIFLVVRGLC